MTITKQHDFLPEYQIAGGELKIPYPHKNLRHTGPGTSRRYEDILRCVISQLYNWSCWSGCYTLAKTTVDTTQVRQLFIQLMMSNQASETIGNQQICENRNIYVHRKTKQLCDWILRCWSNQWTVHSFLKLQVASFSLQIDKQNFIYSATKTNSHCSRLLLNTYTALQSALYIISDWMRSSNTLCINNYVAD